MPTPVNHLADCKSFKLFKRGLPWVILFVISMITFDTYWWHVNSDMAHWYVTPALNILLEFLKTSGRGICR